MLWEGREGAQGGGGPLCVATQKNVKIAEIHSIKLCFFGHEDLFITNLCIKVHEKNKDKASYYN
jgi:hypothetical protein